MSHKPSSTDVVVARLLQPVRLTPVTSAYLDGIRALAALAVVLFHWRGFYFVDYGHLAAGLDTYFVRTVYAATRLGHQAVMVFFVLSGFLISSSILRNIEGHTWSWRDYLIDRCVRLYTVLLPGLLLGATWDFLGVRYFNASGIYSRPLVPFEPLVAIANLTPNAFIGNLLFLQSRLTSVFGSNGPLWSLFNEFWYYVLFPVLVSLVLCVLRRDIIKTFGYILLAAMTVWILGPAIGGFIIWLAGCAVGLAARSIRFGDNASWFKAIYIFCCGATFCYCLAATRDRGSWLGSDLAVGISFACLLYGILQVNIPVGTGGLKLAKTCAGFSYTLYVVHFPVLFFIRATWLPNFRWQPDLRHLIEGLYIVVFVTLYAFVVAKLTERHTAMIRIWVQATLFGDAVRSRRGSPQSLPCCNE